MAESDMLIDELHNADHIEPYLRSVFECVGMTDIYFINAQAKVFSPSCHTRLIYIAPPTVSITAQTLDYTHHFLDEII